MDAKIIFTLQGILKSMKYQYWVISILKHRLSVLEPFFGFVYKKKCKVIWQHQTFFNKTTMGIYYGKHTKKGKS